MSRKPYIATVKEVLKTSDPFPQLVKLTEGSQNIAEVLAKLTVAEIPVGTQTLRTTVRSEMAKDKGGRVRKSSDLYRILSAPAGRPVGSFGKKRLALEAVEADADAAPAPAPASA